MKYRQLQISDYDAVMALWQSCDGVSLKHADSRAGIEKYLDRNPGLSFVAVGDAGIVGSIMAGHDGKRGYVQHLAVADAARNGGIGGELVELCLAALKSQGIIKTHVHVIGENETGRAFWSNRGWTQRAEIAMYSFINGNDSNA